jgi:hypothetical protein
MHEQEFWNIIADAQQEEYPCECIKCVLVGMSRDEIVSFHDILSKKVASACTIPLLEASFVIASYVSDDGFRDFRAWLISQGAEKFGKAVIDPESIADWLDESVVDQIDGGWMLSVARDAYVQADGEEEEFFQKVSPEPDPKMVQEWPKNKAEYRSKYPQLVEKYWNDERIREMHRD